MIVATFTNSKVEMGNDFHGFYYWFSKDSQET
jgi:hypothetical protein